MKKTVISLLVGVAVTLSANPQAIASNQINTSVQDDIVVAGDVLQMLVPATGLFAAWMYDDWEGAKQVTYSTIASATIVEGLKKSTERQRPNEVGTSSFPSGHTAAAFSGAAFLQSRYGSAWGIPAYGAAAFVAYSRVHGKRHHVDDVMASAGISILVNQYFVSPYFDENIQVGSMAVDGGVGVNIKIKNAAFNSERTERGVHPILPIQYDSRFELGLGAHTTNGGALVAGQAFKDDPEFDREFKPFVYMNYQRDLNNDNHAEIYLNSTDSRERGVIAKDQKLGKNEYNKGQDVLANFQHIKLGATLYKGYQPFDALYADFGLGLYSHLLSFQMDDDKNGGNYAKEDSWRLMPNLAMKFNYEITDKLSLIAKGQYQKWSTDSYIEAESGVNYKLNKQWDMGVKYVYADASFNSNAFNAVYDSQAFALTFANRF
ncbi:phosphatase PAP2 family protein [Photobacterium kagoshimensis]|uniref:phosphatase PAP2 family protein n=1 Tax=Photobacterium kagoshimensis TaxID=2910242 RepID=UPI003D0C796A